MRTTRKPADGQTKILVMCWAHPVRNGGISNAALDLGLRGLPGGSSLAQLLAEKRGVRNMMALPDLSY